MAVDPLTVAIIRTFNSRSRYLRVEDYTDEDLMSSFGGAAQPLADGLRDAIREEVARQIAQARRENW